jgi:hypothetical protein
MHIAIGAPKIVRGILNGRSHNIDKEIGIEVIEDWHTLKNIGRRRI